LWVVVELRVVGADTVEAVEDGTVVGTGTATPSAAHRDCAYVHIEVDQSVRRQGIGRAIFAELRQLRPEPLTARAMASRPGRLAFAEALGFDVLMTCPAPQLDPRAPAVREWVAQQPATRLIPAARAPRDQFLDAWTECYVWTHATWLPVHDPQTTRQVLVETQLEALDLDRSLVSLDDHDTITGVGLLYPDVWDNRSFALCETVSPHTPDGTSITAALVAGVLDKAAQSGLPMVEFEGHESDAHVAVLHDLPATAADPLTLLIHRR
jgi:GNAT superfamily N-acetyltransferase